EEVMRASGVVPIIWRVAAEDFEYRGTPVAAGTRLWLMLAAAHDDPAIFGDTRFNIQASRPEQLSFGHGPHFCLGAQLARGEMHEALPILAQRLPGLALAGEPVHRPQLAGFIGPQTLPVRFTPAGEPSAEDLFERARMPEEASCRTGRTSRCPRRS